MPRFSIDLARYNEVIKFIAFDIIQIASLGLQMKLSIIYPNVNDGNIQSMPSEWRGENKNK